MTTTNRVSMEQLVAQSDAVIDGASIEELEQIAKEALEPGGDADNVVNSPSADMPLPMTVGEMSSAGWVWVFDRRTGERSICNRNMLSRQFQKKRPENADGFPVGERVFTTNMSEIFDGVVPKRGTLLCMLHKDHPDREFHISLGLPTCRKANLRTSLDVRLHMQHRHKSEWSSIEEDRVAKERREDRDFQRSMMQQVSGVEPVAQAETESYRLSMTAKHDPAAFSWVCEKCGESYSANSKRGHSLAKMHHDKKCSG